MKMIVITIVVRVIGTFCIVVERRVEELKIRGRIEMIQTTA